MHLHTISLRVHFTTPTHPSRVARTPTCGSAGTPTCPCCAVQTLVMYTERWHVGVPTAPHVGVRATREGAARGARRVRRASVFISSAARGAASPTYTVE